MPAPPRVSSNAGAVSTKVVRERRASSDDGAGWKGAPRDREQEQRAAAAAAAAAAEAEAAAAAAAADGGGATQRWER
jgi:hypothetical protein